MVLNDPGDNFSDALVLMKVAAANLYEISVSPESLTYMHAWLDVFDSLQSPGQQPARPMLASARHQHESSIDFNVFPPS